MKHPRVEIYKTTVLPESTHPVEEWRWRLKAANGEIVATGESYASERDTERGFTDAASTFLSVASLGIKQVPVECIEIIDTPEDGD